MRPGYRLVRVNLRRIGVPVPDHRTAPTRDDETGPTRVFQRNRGKIRNGRETTAPASGQRRPLMDFDWEYETGVTPADAEPGNYCPEMETMRDYALLEDGILDSNGFCLTLCCRNFCCSFHWITLGFYGVPLLWACLGNGELAESSRRLYLLMILRVI